MKGRDIEMTRRITKQALIRVAALVLAALVMAVGLEWLNQRLLPPIFMESDVEYYFIDQAKIESGATYLHPSGKMAYGGTWDFFRLGVLFVLQLLILIVLFPLKAGRKLLRFFEKKCKSIAESFHHLRDLGKRAAIFFISLGLSFLLIRFIAMDASGKSNWVIDVFSLCAGIAVAMLLTFRKTLAARPEVFFLCLTLLVGGLLAFLLPDATTVSWDDGYHFWHAKKFSQLGQAYFTGQDMSALEAQNIKNYALGEEREAFLHQQDDLDAQGAVYVTGGFRIPPGSFWLAAHGLGLFLGNLFHANYWMTWSLGRFTGLLAYALVGYFAIRRLKSGKMILAAVLMIPEAIFLAANYSYDPGVTSLLALGFSYCFAQWQEPDRKISRSDETIMLTALFLGCLAKQIYFPVMLIPMFLPAKKFGSRKERKTFLLADILLILILIASFVIPFVTGDGTGDQRGGSDVNAFGQVRYVLENPLTFLSVLARFLADYLDPAKAGGFMSSFAYMGNVPGTVLCQLILAIVAFTDKHPEDGELGGKPGLRLWFEVLLLGTVAMFASSMYVSYTGVGSSWISGCQPRYLIPMVFPAMMLLGSHKIQNNMNPALYHGLALGGMACVGFTAVFRACVSLYG